jgi:DNA helicase HerA-like ATPase
MAIAPEGNGSAGPDMSAEDRVTLARPPAELMQRLEADIASAGGEQLPDPAMEGAIGATMFDQPGSEDNSVTVLLPKDKAQLAPSQSLVRIKSRRGGDGRTYLGIVTEGPFAEPDSLRADSHLLVTVTTQGGVYLPPYHGRVQVMILGEELADGTLAPPRLRPLPNSPVFVLSEKEAAKVLKADGDIHLGLVVGHRSLAVGIPSKEKAVLPRHTAILGTTGGGKSTTVARLVQQAQAAGMAVILLDVEPEYTHLNEPTEEQHMLAALAERRKSIAGAGQPNDEGPDSAAARRGLLPAGIPADRMTLYHLVGRSTANPTHPRRRAFSFQFARLSPYAAMEILGLSEPQQQRFLAAYDITKEVMRDLGVFPAKNDAKQERLALELDEFERGYPRMTLSLLLDVVDACLAKADRPAKDGRKRKNDDDEPPEPVTFTPFNEVLKSPEGMKSLQKRLHAMNVPGQAVSWRALRGKLGRLLRLKVFYDEGGGVKPLDYKKLLQPGHVSVVDLSDSGASELTNLVIADLLHGVQEAQDEVCLEYERAKANGTEGTPPARVLVIIEEAHEFLSAERIEKMSTLFEQVALIAKRGRKRWIGLTFVTQLPQHLPRQLFGLINSYVLHKITDPLVVETLRKTVSGIDEGLWARLPGLAPGQAIVSFPHLTRPLLAAVDPAPMKLRLTDLETS